jgi:hypothetical protein
VPKNNTRTIKEIWVEALQTTETRSKILLASILTIVILASMPFFFGQIEKRNGIVLNDWVLAYLPAHNVSLVIFAIIWSMGILVVSRALYDPNIYIKYAWTLFFVKPLAHDHHCRLRARSAARHGSPHRPYHRYILGNAVITKDLFYSGHTSTMMLIFLCVDKRSDKIVAFCALVAVIVLLLIQHIHYTIDVLAAPVFVYIIYRITCYFLKLSPPAKITGDEV